jgi:HD-GYP domain-containing protein (c-di-GMP phosphodiesterase class II)
MAGHGQPFFCARCPGRWFAVIKNMNKPVPDFAQIVDRDALMEFRDSLTDRASEVGNLVAKLRRDTRDGAAVAALFRALHTIKGDASLSQFELGVKLVHPVETVLGHLREGKLTFTPMLAEAVMLTVDRLEMSVAALLSGRPLDNLKIEALIDGLDRLSQADGPVIDNFAVDLIEAVTGFRPAAAATNLAAVPNARNSDATGDLEFFQTLALRLDERSPHFKGRNARLLRLALATNSAAGSPVDPTQLQAAVNLHDLGMMFLPDSTWLKSEAMSEAERQQLRTHPAFAAGLASRMGWRDAATMIAQHHEMINGAGYPSGLREEQIVAGAKILAIVDAFESVTLKHNRRGAGPSLLRAAAEINASNTQFSTEWIGHFNRAVRGMVER